MTDQPTPPPDGFRILHKANCRHCGREFMVLDGPGGEKLVHKEPVCDLFNRVSSQDYLDRMAGLNRRQRRILRRSRRKALTSHGATGKSG